MNSRERFLGALHRTPTDRPPVAHVSALTTVELQEATGCWMPEVHHDPVKLMRLCGANHDILGFDAVTFSINYFGEPAALGSQMDWGEPARLPTFTSNPWQIAEDAVIPGDLLQRPPVSTYLEATRLARVAYPEVGVIGKVMGPLSMVQAMHGLDRVMVELLDQPELIRHFLDVAVEVLIRCANAELAAGADAVAIGEGGAGGNMLSPRLHRALLLEPHRRLLQGIKGPTIMHICGDITPRLNTLREVGLTAFNFDWAIEPRVMKAKAGGAFALMGNVNTADLLMGTPDQIAEQVTADLEAGIEIIGPGCAVSPNCPNANLRAIVDTVVQWSERKTH
jgi:[methyl-Co(III) methanol-specific corrinoid protein]:coenzyme M methyltransferase